MTSSTLYREGDDLDSLLAELSDEYAGQVRVIGVEQTRVPGVRGMFAKPRIAVRYRLEPAEISALSAPPSADPLAELIDRAETAESRVRAARDLRSLESATRESVGSNAEFAELLLELAAQKAAARTGTAAPTPAPAAPTPAPAAPAARTTPRPRPRPGAPARTLATSAPAPAVAAPAPAPVAAPLPVFEPAPAPAAVAAPAAEAVVRSTQGLMLRRELAELGVPIHLVPDDAEDVQGAVHTIVRRLPPAPRPPIGEGRVLAIVGPAAHAAATARQIRDAQRGDVEAIWAVGIPRGQARGTTLLQDVWSVAGAAEAHRERGTRLVLAVVATDIEDVSCTPSRVLRALRPDAVWAVVDATRKPADTRKHVSTIDLVDALVVVGATDTASPATVLELDLPVAMLDGHAATAQRWTAALFDTVGGLES